MLALTRRDACRQALFEVLPAIPGWQRVEHRPVFVTSFAEAQRASSGRTACLVDLGSALGSADDIISSTRRLLGSRPWLNIVLFAAHVDPDLEAEVIFGLRDVPCLSLIQPGELRDPARWMSLLDDQFVERHALRIEADLRAASPPGRASLFDDAEIRDLLRHSARVGRVGAFATASGRERVGMWRRLKRRWGRSPSEMLSLFRVLWAAYLHHEGFANAEIARLLGFRDGHHFARTLGARLGIRKSVLNTLGYPELVAGVAKCLTQGAPVSGLVRQAAAFLKESARLSILVTAALGSAFGPRPRPTSMGHQVETRVSRSPVAR